MRVVLLGSLLLVVAICGCCHAEKSTDGSRRCALRGTLIYSKRRFYSVTVRSKSLPLDSCTVATPGIRLAVRGDYVVLQGSRRAWTGIFSSLRLDLKCPNHTEGACVRLTLLGKGKHGSTLGKSGSRSSTWQQRFSDLGQPLHRLRRHAASRLSHGSFEAAEPKKKASGVSFLNAFAATVLAMVLVVSILACAKKSKKSDLDTETPLPPVIGTNSMELTDEDSHLYDDAERAKASMPQGPEDNYEDLEAGKAAIVSNRGQAGKGLPPKRSSHTDIGVTKAKSSHTDMVVSRSLHHMDSAPQAHLASDGRLPEMGVPSFDRPGTSLHEDDEPPPPLPMKTEGADILYDVGPELSKPQSPPAYKAQAPAVSNLPDAMLVSQASHVSKTLAMSVEASAWIQKQEKIDEDDGPPPALPPKTAEAEMIYGENIPLSMVNNKLVAKPEKPPAQPLKSQSSLSEAKAIPSSLTKQVNVTDEYDDDEAAPSLPPKTAGAEELYDYVDNPNRPVPPPKRASCVPESGLSYTEVSFKAAESAPAVASKPVGSVLAESVDTSVYADVSFQ